MGDTYIFDLSCFMNTTHGGFIYIIFVVVLSCLWSSLRWLRDLVQDESGRKGDREGEDNGENSTVRDGHIEHLKYTTCFLLLTSGAVYSVF